MINFFRKIRRQLLSDSKVSKYLVYALGEIVLVVIGILIALQINNWNEYQKELITEVKVLDEVVENLKANIIRLQSMIDRCTVDNQSADIIISVIADKLPYSDSLYGHFYLALNPVDEGSFLSFVGYESLKNVGFEIIHTNQVKKEIINLFEGIYRDLQAKYDRATYSTTSNLIKFREQHFTFQIDSVRHRIGHKPLDFNLLKNDKHFRSYLEATKGLRVWINESLYLSLEKTQSVLKLVEDHLRQ